MFTTRSHETTHGCHVVVGTYARDPGPQTCILSAIVPAADYRRSGQGRNLSNSRRDIGKRRETSLVGSNDRVGASEPEPPAGLPAGKGGKERGGDPDRQKVLTYRQVDARVHSNTSVHDLWRRTHERVNSVFYVVLITPRLLVSLSLSLSFLKFYRRIIIASLIMVCIYFKKKENAAFLNLLIYFD